MVNAIIQITTVLVVVVAIVNMGYAVLLGARLVRRVQERHPERWLELCLPAWRSPREALNWLATWRAILGSADPLIAARRGELRVALLRHAQLFAWSESWAMLVVLIAPYSA
ncbi:MAG TPA: hypothetical protein VIE36_11635 [Methylomirabilota bacterium]|jgi:hypothetical protein